MTHTPTLTPTPREQSIRVPVLWGLAFGAIQAASPLALRWLDQATVQALLLALIAAITLSSSYEPARATAGHVPGAAPSGRARGRGRCSPPPSWRCPARMTPTYQPAARSHRKGPGDQSRRSQRRAAGRLRGHDPRA